MSIHKGTPCDKHNITFYGPMCPQCIKDEEKKQFEKIIEPLKKAEQKREAQEQLRLILAKLEKATLVKETTRYKLSICPYCHKPSLFFFKSHAKYECVNYNDCSLNSTIRLLTEKSNR